MEWHCTIWNISGSTGEGYGYWSCGVKRLCVGFYQEDKA